MHRMNGARVGGSWLAIASCLIIATLALHGPIDPDLGVQMNRVAGRSMVWVLAHWIAAAAFSAYAMAGLLVLISGSRLIGGWGTASAWAALPVLALWTLTTAIAEATAVTNAALAGNTERFVTWWAFAEGKANGFAFLALGVAVIASNEARFAGGATPAWAAWTAAVASVLSFTGWALGMWFGIAPGSVLWLASSIVMSLWTAWFGLTLARSPASAGQTAGIG